MNAIGLENTKVSQFIDAGTWVLPIAYSAKAKDMWDCIHKVELPTGAQVDKIARTRYSHGQYTLRSAWDLIIRKNDWTVVFS